MAQRSPPVTDSGAGLAEVVDRNIAALLERRRRRLELDKAHRPELEELAKDVAPEAVLDRIEDAERALVGAGGGKKGR